MYRRYKTSTQICKWTDGQTHGQMDDRQMRKIEKRKDKQMDEWADIEKNSWMNRCMDEIERQWNGETNRWMNVERQRQIVEWT